MKITKTKSNKKWLWLGAGFIMLATIAGVYFISQKPKNSTEEILAQVSDKPKVIYNVNQAEPAQVKLMSNFVTAITFPKKEKLVQKNILFAGDVDGNNLKKRASAKNIKIVAAKNNVLLLSLVNDEETQVSMTVLGKAGDEYKIAITNAAQNDVTFGVDVKNVFLDTLARLETDGKKISAKSKKCVIKVLDNAAQLQAPSAARQYGEYVFLRYDNNETVAANIEVRAKVIENLIMQQVFVKGTRDEFAFNNLQRFENVLIVKAPKVQEILIKKDNASKISVVCEK